MVYDRLPNIKWSKESLKLKDFVSRYELPQIVCVDDGNYGSGSNDTFFSGQKLKLHSVTSELTALCYDTNKTPYQMPLLCQEPVEFFIREHPKHCSFIADIAKLSPLPNYVITQGTFFISIGDGSNGVHIRKNEKLRVMFRTEQATSQPKDYLTFRSEAGDMFELPFKCQAGFQPIYLKETYLLNQILPNQATSFNRSVYFKFVNPQFCYHQLGVLKCKEVKTRKYAVASSMQDNSHYVFSIPMETEIAVRVAEGTKNHDSEYENVRALYQNFKGIEEELKKARLNEVLKSAPNKQESVYENFDNKRYLPKKHSFDHKRENRHQSQSVPLSKPQTEQQQKRQIPKSENIYAAVVNLHPTKKSNSQTWIKSLVKVERYLSPAEEKVASPVTETQKPTEDKKFTPKVGAPRRTQSLTTEPIPGTGNHANNTPVKGSKEENAPSAMTKSKRSKTDSTNSTPVEDMSVKELCEGLENLRLEKHVGTFRENQIDGQLLCRLTENEFKEIGLSGFEIRKIVSFREGWLPKIS